MSGKGDRRDVRRRPAIMEYSGGWSRPLSLRRVSEDTGLSHRDTLTSTQKMPLTG
jgi:hypothetical protein